MDDSLNINTLLGLAMIVVSIPAAAGWTRPNRWYGVRVPQAYKSERVGLKINRFGGWVSLLYGTLLVALGLLLGNAHISEHALTLWYLFLPATFLLPLLIILAYANRFS